MSYPLTKTKYVSVKDFAEMFSLSKARAYELIHTKGFPVINFGDKNYRIDLNAAMEFIQKRFN